MDLKIITVGSVNEVTQRKQSTFGNRERERERERDSKREGRQLEGKKKGRQREGRQLEGNRQRTLIAKVRSFCNDQTCKQCRKFLQGSRCTRQ